MVWVLIIALVVTLADQWTKFLVVNDLAVEDSRVVVAGYLNLVHWRNTGAAWGILQNYPMTLALVSVAAMVALYLFRHSLQLQQRGCRVALGLIAGGILGNLIDRLRLGSVVDFVDCYVGHYHWPAFNVADSAICVGVGLYVVLTWRSEHLRQGANPKQTPRRFGAAPK